MPKRHQQRPAKEEVGRNNPEKSTPITTGTPKKEETYRREATEHKNSTPVPQHEKVPPSRDLHPGLTHKADSQGRMEDRERRSGSESNAHRGRKAPQVHGSERLEQPQAHPAVADTFEADLHRNNQAGENSGPVPMVYGYAQNIKDLHVRLADLSNEELKSLVLVPEGSRLEQGAKYIDLKHLEEGEFTALANMTAEGDHLYVPKKETDYLLWNRLNQIDNPARLDEAES